MDARDNDRCATVPLCEDQQNTPSIAATDGGDQETTSTRRSIFRPSTLQVNVGMAKTTSRQGLARHAATAHTSYFRLPNSFIPIPPERVAEVLAFIRRGHVHRRREALARIDRMTASLARSLSPTTSTWSTSSTVRVRALPPAAAASAASASDLRSETPPGLWEDAGFFHDGRGDGSSS